MIIFDGKLIMFTEVDKNTEFPLAYIEKGTIINPHNFLSGAPGCVSVKCMTSVTYYYLSYKIMRNLAMIYPTLKAKLYEASKKSKYHKMHDTLKLDY